MEGKRFQATMSAYEAAWERRNFLSTQLRRCTSTNVHLNGNKSSGSVSWSWRTFLIADNIVDLVERKEQ